MTCLRIFFKCFFVTCMLCNKADYVVFRIYVYNVTACVRTLKASSSVLHGGVYLVGRPLAGMTMLVMPDTNPVITVQLFLTCQLSGKLCVSCHSLYNALV